MRFAGLVSCLFVIVFVSGLYGQEDTATSRVLMSTDGLCRIDLPSGWDEQSELNDSATLQAGDPREEKYLIVITDSKEDFQQMDLEKHSEITRKGLLESLQTPEIDGPKELKIGGHPALQYEIRGGINNLNIVYLHTTVETANYYHQILAWTLRSRFDKNQAALQEVISSFREMEENRSEE